MPSIRADSKRLVKSGYLPACDCGVEVTGVSCAVLRRLRSAARSACYTHAAGRSLTVDLALCGDKFDPAYKCNREPIVAWMRGMWDSLVHRTRLVRAFNAAIRAQNGVKNKWKTVRGPAGAALATMHRRGWSADSAHKVRTHRGEFHILSNSPLERMRPPTSGSGGTLRLTTSRLMASPVVLLSTRSSRC